MLCPMTRRISPVAGACFVVLLCHLAGCCSVMCDLSVLLQVFCLSFVEGQELSDPVRVWSCMFKFKVSGVIDNLAYVSIALSDGAVAPLLCSNG